MRTYTDAALLVREDTGARLLLGQAGERSCLRAHPPVEADHGQLGQPVLPSDLEVGGVVARRHLQRSGSELRVHDRAGVTAWPAGVGAVLQPKKGLGR